MCQEDCFVGCVFKDLRRGDISSITRCHGIGDYTVLYFIVSKKGSISQTFMI